MTQHVPILLYHSVSERAGVDSFAVSPDSFARHVAAIAASGRTTLTIGELAECLRAERPFPTRCMAITFDDGYDDTVDAVELLRAHGLSSTVYLTTGQLGEGSAIRADQVVTLAGWRDSVELGAHSVTHPHLDELGLAAAGEEIRASKDALERLIGRSVSSFAYPHGAYDARIRGLVVDAGFASAAAVKNALSHPHDDPFAIARWTVRSTTTADEVTALLAGTGAPLAWRRQRVRTRAFRVVRRARRSLAQAGS
jgi:peptidoglycan/xylan/chitin deacetylase (PgdA/CDA1 family)